MRDVEYRGVVLKSRKGEYSTLDKIRTVIYGRAA